MLFLGSTSSSDHQMIISCTTKNENNPFLAYIAWVHFIYMTNRLCSRMRTRLMRLWWGKWLDPWWWFCHLCFCTEGCIRLKVALVPKHNIHLDMYSNSGLSISVHKRIRKRLFLYIRLAGISGIRSPPSAISWTKSCISSRKSIRTA